jgi:glycosyltransferase involved in cell wall biosynthesis
MASEVSSAFGLPRENIQVIPNGVDPTNFARPFSKDDLRRRYADPTEKLVLYVGRLVYEKGVGVLISAVPRVLSKVNAKFVIVGDGYMRDDLSREARRVGVADKVFFTGFLDDDTAKALYRCADVCVVPSLYEPFGIVALEAMASGTPVVATNVGGLGEIVDHGRTGVHVFPNDPDSLAWGILRVLTAEELSKALAPNAYEKALRVYSWKRIAEMTERVYRQVLAEYSAGFWKPT